MSNGYTNKQILLAFREEILRRKKLAYGLKDYIQYDDSKYLVESGWSIIGSRKDLHLLFDTKKKRLLNIFSNPIVIQYTQENGWTIGNALKKERLTERLPIINEKEFYDYLLFLYEELGKSLMLDETIDICGSSFILNSDLYSIGYTGYSDIISIVNLEDKKNIDLNLLQDYLNQTQNGELFPDYIVKSLEKNADKNIIFDENKEIIRKKQIAYKIEEKDNSLILKRKRFNTN